MKISRFLETKSLSRLTLSHLMPASISPWFKLLRHESCWEMWNKSWKCAYRIMPNKRTPPTKRPSLFLFMISYYKELKEKSDVIKEMNAKKQ